MIAGIDKAGMVAWLGRAAAVVMLALLGWLGAQIYWTLSAPEVARPSAQMETDLGRVQAALTARHLYGVYVVASAAAVPSDIRLNGAIAAQKPGQRAYALLSIEGKPTQLVREGEELAPGITLQHVAARQVELLRGGQPVTLQLPESSKADNAKAGAAKGGAAGAAAGPNAAVAGVAETPPAPAILPNAPPTPVRKRNRRSTTDDT